MGAVSGGAKEGEGDCQISEKHFAVNKCQIPLVSPKFNFHGLLIVREKGLSPVIVHVKI